MKQKDYRSNVANTIASDTVRSGHLIDGSPDPIVQSCTLIYEPGAGPVLAVPYLVGNPQFASAHQWFHNRSVPTTLLYADNLGVLTFSGTRWRGRSGARIEVGRLDADVVILGRPKSIKDEYQRRLGRHRGDTSPGVVPSARAALEEVTSRSRGRSMQPVADGMHSSWPLCSSGESSSVGLRKRETLEICSSRFDRARVPG
jgi:hypothetical protein